MNQAGNIEIFADLIRSTPRSKTPWKQLEAYTNIFAAIKPARYLEIGAFEGRSLALYSIFASLFGSEVDIVATSIDSWDGGDEHKQSKLDMNSVEQCFDHVTNLCRKLLPGHAKLEKLKGYSDDGLRHLSDRKKFYDLILVDAGHKAKEVLVDLVHSWGLLRDGGVMILDDYTWMPMHHVEHGHLLESPRLGIDSFINCFHDELTIVSNLPLLQLYLMKLPRQSMSHDGLALADVPVPKAVAGLRSIL